MNVEAVARLAGEQKRALHATIHGSTAPTKAIAAAAGISYQFLTSAANVSEPDSLPFARLPILLEQCDDLTLLRFLAARQGCDVFRLPRVEAAPDRRRTAQTMREFAEFVEASADAMDDGVIAPEEFARIEREGLDAVRAILELVADARVRVQRPLFDGGDR